MFSITAQDVKTLPATHDSTGRHPQGEQASIVAQGVIVHPALVQRLPETYLTPLTSAGDTHTYSLSLRGYTVEQFIAVVTAFARGDFKTGESLINKIAPPMREEW